MSSSLRGQMSAHNRPLFHIKRLQKPSMFVQPRYRSIRSCAGADAQGAESMRKAFKFRHFMVYHDRCAMKVGTDAMLLGSWAPPPASPSSSSPPSPGADCRRPQPQPRILDVGTGTGVLALMMAQKTDTRLRTSTPAPASSHADNRCHHVANSSVGSAAPTHAAAAAVSSTGCGAQILAIDVDAAACAQAAENAALSPWAHRIRVLHASLQQLAAAAAELKAAGAEADMKEGEAVEMGLMAEAVAAAVKAVAAVEVKEEEAAEVKEGAVAAAAAIPADAVGPFDLIISNPPYFVHSRKPAKGGSARSAARHADVALPFSDLAAGCTALLARGGSVCVVLPPPESERFCVEAAAVGLVLVEQVRVFTAPEDERERRHLLRLQRAADLLPPAATSPPLPAVSTLVVNGPKQQPQPQPQPAHQPQLQPMPRDAVPTLQPSQQRPPHDSRQQQLQQHPCRTGAVAPGVANSPAQPPAPQHVRPLSPEYLDLTAAFHDPAFFTSYAARTAAAAAAATGPAASASSAPSYGS